MRRNVIREGDRVKVIRAEVLTRCGYPKAVADYMTQAKEILDKTGEKFGRRETDRIVREITYGLARRDHFGGRERTLHLSAMPELLGEVLPVEKVRTVRTGYYFGPWGNGEDYEPGGLDNMKAHRIAVLYPPGRRWLDPKDLIHIPVAHLERIPDVPPLD